MLQLVVDYYLIYNKSKNCFITITFLLSTVFLVTYPIYLYITKWRSYECQKLQVFAHPKSYVLYLSVYGCIMNYTFFSREKNQYLLIFGPITTIQFFTYPPRCLLHNTFFFWSEYFSIIPPIYTYEIFSAYYKMPVITIGWDI